METRQSNWLATVCMIAACFAGIAVFCLFLDIKLNKNKITAIELRINELEYLINSSNIEYLNTTAELDNINQVTISSNPSVRKLRLEARLNILASEIDRDKRLRIKLLADLEVLKRKYGKQ